MHGDGYSDLGFARLDVDRVARTGDPEVVYGAGKTVEQGVALVAALREAHPDRPALVTRAAPELVEALQGAYGDQAQVDELARAVAVGAAAGGARARSCVVSAGTSDGPVAAEAAFTARVVGAGVERVTDVGVAGIHRLLAVRDVLDAADCLVVVAGHGRRAAQRGRRADRGAAGRGADQRRVRRRRSAGWPRCSRCSTPARPAWSWRTSTTASAPGVFAARVARRAAPR